MSNRMFMVVKHIKVLRNSSRPQEGFIDNESFHITKNIKKKDLTEASIILDIPNQKIVKNRFSERTFDDLFKYMSEHYSDYINKWLRSNTNVS